MLTLAAVAPAWARMTPAGAVSPDVVVSQVYGGGGNSGATLTHDFIELYNRGDVEVDLGGWSVQYASAVGSTWQVTPLTGSIRPGRHYLVQEAQGAGGSAPLPAPDATGTIPMGATAGKVALVTSGAPLACGIDCDHAPAVRDFVGYGTSANDFESSPAPSLSNTTAARRLVGGGADSDNNATDFVAGTPNPRNTRSGPPIPADLTGDGKTDVSVFRPSTGSWFVTGGVTRAFGTGGDIPVPGDYDNDGVADPAVFRPSNGYWFVLGGPIANWGTGGDIPVPGDYDGDGDTDMAVFRPANGLWFFRVQGSPVVAFGTAGDIPVPWDYDNDGTTDIAVFRPSNGIWFVHEGATTAWGTAGDIPVPGDYDENVSGEVAVFRPSQGLWLVQGRPAVAWGTSGDIPVPGRYNNNVTTDLAVFRPSNGLWILRVNGDPIVAFGTGGDLVLPLPDAIRSLSDVG